MAQSPKLLQLHQMHRISLHYLCSDSLLSFGTTCRAFRVDAAQDYLWARICQRQVCDPLWCTAYDWRLLLPGCVCLWLCVCVCVCVCVVERQILQCTLTLLDSTAEDLSQSAKAHRFSVHSAPFVIFYCVYMISTLDASNIMLLYCTEAINTTLSGNHFQFTGVASSLSILDWL